MYKTQQLTQFKLRGIQNFRCIIHLPEAGKNSRVLVTWGKKPFKNIERHYRELCQSPYCLDFPLRTSWKHLKRVLMTTLSSSEGATWHECKGGHGGALSLCGKAAAWNAGRCMSNTYNLKVEQSKNSCQKLWRIIASQCCQYWMRWTNGVT